MEALQFYDSDGIGWECQALACGLFGIEDDLLVFGETVETYGLGASGDGEAFNIECYLLNETAAISVVVEVSAFFLPDGVEPETRRPS